MIAPRATALLVAGLVLAGCSASRHSDTTSPAAGSGSSGLGSSTGVAGSGAARSTSASTDGVSPGAPAGSSGAVASGQTRSGSAAPGGTSSGGGGSSSRPQPGRPGAYRYAVTGTFAGQAVPPAGTLTVSTATNGTQTFTLVNSGPRGGSTLTENISFRSDGVYLLSLGISSTTAGYPPYSETFTPTAGAVRIVGSSEGTSSTTFAVASDDARATVTARVLGRSQAHVGGATLSALHLTFSSADLAGRISSGLFSANYTGSFAVDALLSPATLLPYRQQSSFALSVKAPKITVTSDSTATLQSTTPS